MRRGKGRDGCLDRSCNIDVRHSRIFAGKACSETTKKYDWLIGVSHSGRSLPKQTREQDGHFAVQESLPAPDRQNNLVKYSRTSSQSSPISTSIARRVEPGRLSWESMQVDAGRRELGHWDGLMATRSTFRCFSH